MGCTDARNGILNTPLTISCSYLLTKVIGSTFTDGITQGLKNNARMMQSSIVYIDNNKALLLSLWYRVAGALEFLCI